MSKKLRTRVASAVKHFWETRTRQSERQGTATGIRDSGNRTAATGGKQLDELSLLIAQLLAEAGVPRESIHLTGLEPVTLPGYFRPTKRWDVVAVVNGNLIAAVECKALCGPSFGNNYNNRIEEALGSAADLWTAYREGKFDRSPRPFLGYLLMLEEAPSSIRPVAVHEKHFPVFEEFRAASYARRCEESIRRLVLERQYDAAALLLCSKDGGIRGKYREPASDLTFERFAAIMTGHVAGSINAIRAT